MSGKKPKGPVSFWKAFIANGIDMIIIVVLSVTLLLIMGVILSALGRFISDITGMFLILIIITTVVYNTIMQSSRNSSTLGEKAAKIYLNTREEK
ncbi:MAG: RDD family protein [Solirubrobacterales bacterium]